MSEITVRVLGMMAIGASLAALISEFIALHGGGALFVFLQPVFFGVTLFCFAAIFIYDQIRAKEDQNQKIVTTGRMRRQQQYGSSR